MRNERLLPLIVATALFIENMDSTAIATSLPQIAADLGTEPVALKLALTTYLLALAVFIPVSGWVADRFGARRTFVVAIAVFLLGSLAKSPHWVLDLDPFSHIPRVGSGSFTATPLVWLLVLDATLIILGALAFRRRDLR